MSYILISYCTPWKGCLTKAVIRRISLSRRWRDRLWRKTKDKNWPAARQAAPQLIPTLGNLRPVID
jgi:hypothetical protein